MATPPRPPPAVRRRSHPVPLEAAVALAQAHLEQEAWGPLLAALEAPLGAARRTGDAELRATALNLAGIAHEALGDAAAAERAWVQAARASAQAAPSLNLLALLNAQGRHAEALALARRLEDALPPHGRDRARVRCEAGLAHLGLGDARAAGRALDGARGDAEVRRRLEAFAASGHPHAPLALALLTPERSPGAAPHGEAARRAFWDGLSRVVGHWPRWCREALGLGPGRGPTDAQLAELVHARCLVLDKVGAAGVDLAPLGAFPALEELRVIGGPVHGAERLGALPTLRRLVLFGCGLGSVAWAARLPALEVLDVTDNALDDLSPLAAARALRELHLDGNAVEDLSPLAGLARLRVLSCERNRVGSLAPVAGLASLEELFLEGNPVRDLSPLARCGALRVLHCGSDDELQGLEALAGLPGLEELAGAFPPAALEAFGRAHRRVRIH